MAENLKIIIDADVSGLARGASEATKATGQIAKEAQKSAKILQGDFSKGANTASASVINLSRIVQDAPYAFTTGFGSIANNIDPLFESFRRLKTETGSTSAAFSSLGKSLLGGAGIGLAISLATSLITSFSLGLFNAKKNSQELDDALKGLAANASKDLTQLTTLVGVAKNLSASMKDRELAVAALNEQYKEYLPYLDSEKISLENIDASYKSIAQNILNQAVLKGIQQEITIAVEQTAKELIVLEREEAKRARRQEQFNELQSKTTELTKDQIAELQRLRNTNPGITDEEIALLQKGVKGQEQYNKALNDGFGAAIKQKVITQGQAQAFGSYEERAKRLKEELFKLLDPLLQLTNKFADLNIKVPDLKLPKTKELKVDVDKGVFRFEKAEYAFPEPTREDLKPLAKGLEGRVKINPVDLDTKKFLKDMTEMTDIINRTLKPAFDSAFTALLDGEEPIKAFFDSLISSVKRLVVELASAAVIAGILSALTGGSFGSIFSKITGIGGGAGLAEGGIVPSGFPNDTFPARLTSGEAVIPLNRLEQMMAANNSGGGGSRVSRIRGRDILLVESRTRQSQSRLVGRVA